MGRPRAFDEQQVTAAAAELFSGRAYDAISIDDLVSQLGVHRNSLYKVFGSKRGLYLAALRHHLSGRSGAELAGDLDFVLLAAVDRAPHDPEVAGLVAGVFTALDELLGPDDTARLLGARLRGRATNLRRDEPDGTGDDRRQ